jgi:hypothetical protein
VNTTRLGRGIRATAQDPDTAVLMGVNIDRVVLSTFLIGGILAGLAAALYGVFFELTQYNVGFSWASRRSPPRCSAASATSAAPLIGGLVLGLIENYGASIFGTSGWTSSLLRAGPRADVPPDRHPRREPAAGAGMSTLTGLRRPLPRLHGHHGLLVGSHSVVRPVDRLLPADHRRVPAAVGNDRLVHDAGVRLGERAVLPIGIYVLLAIGLNVVVGQAGLLDPRLRAFFAIGAYALAVFATKRGWSFWEIVPLGIIIAAAAGSHPRARRRCGLRGDYLADRHARVREIIRITANNLDYTGGPRGISPIPHPPSIRLVRDRRTDPRCGTA